MSSLNGMILGLGLFFLGLQLTGQNMRALSGGSFRNLVRGLTDSPWLAALCGLFAGALMQSATAVTFILVSMLGSGIIQSAAARLVLVWCNVGLTAFAFLAAVNISPIVAYLVGGAGILMGAVRTKPWNTYAGAFLGVGIILFGLEQIGSGLAPLKDALWFHEVLEMALASPLLAFVIGFAASALLQSNTGAAMLVITLAQSGAFGVAEAMPLIYGTNLGAILLRAFLASGLRGSSIRIVRMEDLFCVFGGALMMGLLFAENSGIPLVGALADKMDGGAPIQLAMVFLLSNFIPALVLTPFLPICDSVLKKYWPSDFEDKPECPKYLTNQALADPETALDLIPKELGRLFASVSPARATMDGGHDEGAAPAFVTLGGAIESFCVRLAVENPLTTDQSLRLQRYRAWLHTIRHIGEAVGELAFSLAALPSGAEACASRLIAWVTQNITLGAEATSTMEVEKIRVFFESSKQKDPAVREMRRNFLGNCGAFSPSGTLDMSSMVDDFDIAAWLIHRLSKLQMQSMEQSV